MEETVKRVFAGVELEFTPKCVRGKVTKEQAIDALAEAGSRAILANDFRTFRETTMWAQGVNLNYVQITETEKNDEDNNEKKDALAKIAEILDNAPVTEEIKILDIIVKSFQQQKFSEVLNVACSHNSSSWLLSFEEAEREVLD